MSSLRKRRLVRRLVAGSGMSAGSGCSSWSERGFSRSRGTLEEWPVIDWPPWHPGEGACSLGLCRLLAGDEERGDDDVGECSFDATFLMIELVRILSVGFLFSSAYAFSSSDSVDSTTRGGAICSGAIPLASSLSSPPGLRAFQNPPYFLSCRCASSLRSAVRHFAPPNSTSPDPTSPGSPSPLTFGGCLSCNAYRRSEEDLSPIVSGTISSSRWRQSQISRDQGAAASKLLCLWR